jgi:hypothetical protein
MSCVYSVYMMSILVKPLHVPRPRQGSILVKPIYGKVCNICSVQHMHTANESVSS